MDWYGGDFIYIREMRLVGCTPAGCGRYEWGGDGGGSSASSSSAGASDATKFEVRFCLVVGSPTVRVYVILR